MRAKILLFLVFFSTFLHAEEERPSVEDRYRIAMEALGKQDWKTSIKQNRRILAYHRGTTFAKEADYYLAVAYLAQGEYIRADQYLTRYITTQESPTFFEEAIRKKFEIAKAFDNGGKKHLFHAKLLPKILPARDEALRLYDEVIASLPRDEIAAESLYRKGELLLFFKKYKESVDAFQTLIRRFPKHARAPDSFMSIANVYLKQCSATFPDPAHLELAEINLRKFRRAFPGESRITETEGLILQMKERFAKELFDVGHFYQKTKKVDSAAIYYSTIIVRYPETMQAKHAEKRLRKLGREIPQPGTVAMPSNNEQAAS
ncbi:MAG: tetratricopeptide repeat protein [Candidatus Algichlamydia australiensis]|nr:tetratricopeptide repeat protein [Chlamydiales bacterium]